MYDTVVSDQLTVKSVQLDDNCQSKFRLDFQPVLRES